MMLIFVTLWPDGKATVTPSEPMSPFEALTFRMSWAAWQAVDPVAKLIGESEPVQASRFVFSWEDGVFDLVTEHYV